MREDMISMNRESYDAIAQRWDESRTQLSEAEANALELALATLPLGAHVLDLGCGSGRPIAELLVARQFQVTGVDQSLEMVELARHRMPDQRWIVGNLEELTLGGTFAAVILWDCLFHIPRDVHASILARVRSLLCPGGRVALTVGGSASPAFTDTMFDRTFFYDSHPPNESIALVEQLGLEVLHSDFLNLPNGARDKGRLAIVARAV